MWKIKISLMLYIFVYILEINYFFFCNIFQDFEYQRQLELWFFKNRDLRINLCFLCILFSIPGNSCVQHIWRSSEKNNKQQAISEYEYFNSFQSLYLYFQHKIHEEFKKKNKLLYVTYIFNNVIIYFFLSIII